MESVDLEVGDGIATITLNRPEKHNAMTPGMSAQLVSAVVVCNDDAGVRSVILTGRASAPSASAAISRISIVTLSPGHFATGPTTSTRCVCCANR